MIYVIPEGCTVPLALKCLVTPSLEDEQVLRGWSNMVEWGILKKEFNIMKDEDMEKNLADKRKVSKSPCLLFHLLAPPSQGSTM